MLPTVKILKFGTPQTITIIILKIEKSDVTLHCIAPPHVLSMFNVKFRFYLNIANNLGIYPFCDSDFIKGKGYMTFRLLSCMTYPLLIGLTLERKICSS